MAGRITRFISVNLFKGDIAIWMIYFFLCMVSISEIYSASSTLTYGSGHHWSPMMSQFGFLVAGLVIILIVHRIPCKYFSLLPVVLVPASIVLLLAAMFVGGDVNNAARWFTLAGIRFQPSELAKTSLILALAVILSKTQQGYTKQTKHGVTTVPAAIRGGYSKPFRMCGVLTLVVCGLICLDNLSTAMMLFCVAVVMMFIGHVPDRLMWKGLGWCALVGTLFVTILLVTPDKALGSVSKRATTWKHRIENKIGISKEKTDRKTITLDEVQEQETSAKIAIANSNVWGRGSGNSEWRDFLYHAESDFIYAIVVEELGILGGLGVLLLYVILLIRTGRIAQKCDRYFPAFLAIGLSVMMVVQAMVNMGVAVGLFPVTGQTLPLISRGGTSILITSLNFGMILSISRYADAVAEGKLSARTKSEGEGGEEVVSDTDEYFSTVGID